MHSIGQEGQNNFLTDQMSRFLLSSRVRAPKGPQKNHFDALSIDFPAKVADRHHASKMRPHIIRCPEQRWRKRERLLHLFGDRPRLYTSLSVALSIRTILSGAVVVELGVHRAFGRIFWI